MSDIAINVQGAKNSFLHIPAFLAATGTAAVLLGVPGITDSSVIRAGLKLSGVTINWDGKSSDAWYQQGAYQEPLFDVAAGSLRPTYLYAIATAVAIGHGRARVPGGDSFTERPFDLHEQLVVLAGGTWHTDAAEIEVTLPSTRRSFAASCGTSWGPSLGATITAILLASVADGTSLISDASLEPEVMIIVEIARSQGCDVAVDEPNRLITVTGEPRNRITDIGSIQIPADRIVAATYLMMAALSHRERVRLVGPNLRLDDALLDALSLAGCDIRIDANASTAELRPDPLSLVAVDVVTGPYPGFPTDLQPQMSALLTQAHGRSTLTENVYPQRSTHVWELQKMGAHLEVDGPAIVVTGQRELTGGVVTAHDIRAGAALAVAAIASTGSTHIDGVHHLQRGYEDLPSVIRQLGRSCFLENGKMSIE